jgi:hypothetical protein
MPYKDLSSEAAKASAAGRRKRFALAHPDRVKKSSDLSNASEYHRPYHRLKKYGLTKEACDILLRMQEGKCACCDELLNGKFTVDHNHACCDSVQTCGKCIRGLLCMNCNAGLGNFKDDVMWLLKAICYLRR